LPTRKKPGRPGTHQTRGRLARRITGRTDRGCVRSADASHGARASGQTSPWELCMNQIVYIVGAVVIVLAILGFFGLR